MKAHTHTNHSGESGFLFLCHDSLLNSTVQYVTPEQQEDNMEKSYANRATAAREPAGAYPTRHLQVGPYRLPPPRHCGVTPPGDGARRALRARMVPSLLVGSSSPRPSGRLDLRLRRRLHGGQARCLRDEVLRAAPGDEVDELLAGLVGARGRGRDPEQHGDGHEQEPRGDEQRPEEGHHGAEPGPDRGDRDGGRCHERHRRRSLDPVLPH
ncbi:unnamed protein product [Urochloa decumbens]|uniref:Uncharacterized protein n=1 Tax=Urochloa decumbens TaxID=240449 RepID=A0ABC9AAX0_9POAL